jgi:hypothetical protein
MHIAEIDCKTCSWMDHQFLGDTLSSTEEQEANAVTNHSLPVDDCILYKLGTDRLNGGEGSLRPRQGVPGLVLNIGMGA